MPFVKDLKLSKRRSVTVTLSAAEAARAQHGNQLHRALENKARAAAGKRVLTGVYTSSQADGAFSATFETVPA